MQIARRNGDFVVDATAGTGVAIFNGVLHQAWTRQFDWRVEGRGLQFLGAAISDAAVCNLQWAVPRCRVSPAPMAFWLAKIASTSSDLPCLGFLNPPSPVDHWRLKKIEKREAWWWDFCWCWRRICLAVVLFVFEQISFFSEFI